MVPLYAPFNKSIYFLPSGLFNSYNISIHFPFEVPSMYFYFGTEKENQFRDFDSFRILTEYIQTFLIHVVSNKQSLKSDVYWDMMNGGCYEHLSRLL